VFHLTLEPGYPVWTMLAVVVAALGLAGVFYRRAYRQVRPVQWRVLLALRVFAIVLLVLLLFRPVLGIETEIRQKRALIFLVDASASMATTDGPAGSSRFDQARNRVLDWSDKLGKDFELHVLAFSDRATRLERPGDLAQWNPTGQATSLIRALAAAAGNVPRRDVEAVVLLSDGIHNTAGDPVAVARKQGVVVHAVGVGSSLRGSASYRDIQVTGVECPDRLPVNNRAKITAFVDAIGYGGRVIKVLLEEDGKQLDEAELVLDDAEGSQPVALQFTPTLKGRHIYTVRVPVLSDEKIAQNNQRSAVAQVIDARIRVLYLEGALRAEYGALVDRFLAKDPDVDFCALVQTRRNVFLQRTNIPGLKLESLPSDAATLEKFDVFLIGDLDSTFWRPGSLELLAKRIRAGAGVLTFGGYQSLGPGGYGGSPLEEVLPALVGDRGIGQVTEPFLPVLTPDGRTHPILANIGKFFPSPTAPPQAAGLPPLEGCVKVAKAKPGATVLATYAVPGSAEAPLPVLAVQPVGKGRAAIFTGDTTRNWQQVTRALDQESPFLRFWGQTVRWLANRSEAVKTEASITAHTDKSTYDPEALVTVFAIVRDKEGEGTAQARVTARVQSPKKGSDPVILEGLTPFSGTTETVALAAVPGSTGHYKGVFEAKQTGTYEIGVEGRLGEMELRAEKLLAEVGRPDLEFDRLDLDDRLLSRLAGATGGRYYHISTADRLIEELDRKEQRRRVALEQPLYFPLAYWALFAGLLSLEWFLRKRYQLP
jgi:uncharacterized membrane protein